jgi:hypothetical protein
LPSNKTCRGPSRELPATLTTMPLLLRDFVARELPSSLNCTRSPTRIGRIIPWLFDEKSHPYLDESLTKEHDRNVSIPSDPLSWATSVACERHRQFSLGAAASNSLSRPLVRLPERKFLAHFRAGRLNASGLSSFALALRIFSGFLANMGRAPVSRSIRGRVEKPEKARLGRSGCLATRNPAGALGRRHPLFNVPAC